MTCAYAVRVALQKYSGVASVDVSLSKGLATVKLKPGNKIRPAELWETIRKNGYTNKPNRVLVRGEVISNGSQLKVAGTDEIFTLEGDAKTADEVKKLNGKTVTVEGTLTPDKDLKRAVPLRVGAIK